MSTEPNTRTTLRLRIHARLSKLEDAAQELWRRGRIPKPVPTGKQWLPIILLVAAVVSLVLILLTGLLQLVDNSLAGGVGWWNGDPAGLVADPVHAYLTAHTVGLGVDAATVYWTWRAAAVVFLFLSITGSVGARIGWALHGVATALMVFVGTPDPGRPVAVALTVMFWAALSVPAYRRTRTHVTVHVAHHDEPDWTNQPAYADRSDRW